MSKSNNINISTWPSRGLQETYFIINSKFEFYMIDAYTFCNTVNPCKKRDFIKERMSTVTALGKLLFKLL